MHCIDCLILNQHHRVRISKVLHPFSQPGYCRNQHLLKIRDRNAKYYRKIIDEIPNIDYQHIPNGMTHGNYIFAIDTRNHKIKPTEAVEKFKEKNVLTRPIYSTLSYQQENFKNIQSWRWADYVKFPDYNKVKLPISEDIAINHFEVPVVPSLTIEEMEYVGQSIIDIFQ